ncbi:MAG: hypothetical protein M1817_001159 [Caeruleum heppii]|nr:MAG: hypothetical protein M1817_001159 [Caeruleum heppii]
MTILDVGEAQPPATDRTAAFSGLRTVKSTHRLNQIDRVRANGIGDHVSLPQLVVCGDQSAGKSSVLEGITGIPFPRQDGLCTKFATEIVLRHDPEARRITATLIPHASRNEADRGQFKAYRREIEDFDEVPSVIAEVGALMRIRGYNDITDGPAFAADVLRIEVIGDTGLQLTVVDLPGLIAVANDEQTEEDVKLVAGLVDAYLESSRTIILAVVQATNDIATQGIIQRARTYDPAGQRTVGIITKPDLINESTEGRIALLAANKDTTKLKLGFFLLKNPSPSQLKAGISLDERKRSEYEFFSSKKWKTLGLDMHRVGIDRLRAFLQDLLDSHIERELPKVRAETKTLLAQTENQLVKLGDERPTVAHIRAFLTGLSMRFFSLTQAALDGNYHDVDFAASKDADDPTSPPRLRAEVHRLNGNFAAYMRDRGQRRKLSEKSTNQAGVDADFEPEPELEEGQLLVTKKEFDAWVHKVYLRTRGLELPGNYNHVLLSELFHEQSCRWTGIASGHITQVFATVASFVEDALLRIIAEVDVGEAVRDITNSKLEASRAAALNELQHIIEDEKRQPITYNHYYTDNIQNARQESLKRSIQKAMGEARDEDWNGKLHVSNTAFDTAKLLASLQKRVIVNMDEQACAEALAGLQAYYKVALKTFVDNICRQVIERHILAKLPDIFSPTVVTSFSDEVLLQIASEPERQRERRRELDASIRALRNSLSDLQR